MRLLIAVLAHTDWLHRTVVEQLLRLGGDRRVEKEYLFVTRRPVENARNYVFQKALEKDYDYVLSFDHDNPCRGNPIDLCFLNEDLIFCPTPIVKDGTICINAVFDTKKKGLMEVQQAGTGCFLASRKALETIPQPWFEQSPDGEDTAFCQKAKAAGFKLFIHTQYPCSHFHEVDLLGVLQNSPLFTPGN